MGINEKGVVLEVVRELRKEEKRVRRGDATARGVKNIQYDCTLLEICSNRSVVMSGRGFGSWVGDGQAPFGGVV